MAAGGKLHSLATLIAGAAKIINLAASLRHLSGGQTLARNLVSYMRSNEKTTTEPIFRRQSLEPKWGVYGGIPSSTSESLMTIYMVHCEQLRGVMGELVLQPNNFIALWELSVNCASKEWFTRELVLRNPLEVHWNLLRSYLRAFIANQTGFME